MIHSGEGTTNGIRCRFNPSIYINFQGAKISSDTGILLLREIDERFGITSALEGILQDSKDRVTHPTPLDGHFRKNCYHPLFCFTSSGISLAGKLREGNVHSAHGVLEMLSPIVERYRKHFKQFWLRGDAAFAKPGFYAYCEQRRMTYFIRLK